MPNPKGINQYSKLGRRMTPTVQYHGGPSAFRGMQVKPDSRAYSTSSLKLALRYAKKAGGSVFEVKTPYIPKDVARFRKVKGYTIAEQHKQAAQRDWQLPKRTLALGQPAIESRQALHIIRRLPKARGKASRGSY